MLLAVDDTDSRQGMCTTYLVKLILEEFSEFALLDHPRLVRLNPNIPFKTRGNGAVCLNLGLPDGQGIPTACLDGKLIHHYPEGLEVEPTTEHLERLYDLVGRVSMLDDPATNPGLVLSKKKPDEGEYWGAVREVVQIRSAKESLQNIGALWKGYKLSRGLVGALAAMAWNPTLDKTYELLAYRQPHRWGSVRNVNEASILRMDKRYPSTFQNYDHQNGMVAIVPSSPCPVLFGIRGEDPSDLIEAQKEVEAGEEHENWVLFMTNQATDQHLVGSDISQISEYSSCLIEGTVSSSLHTIEGGHVFFKLAGVVEAGIELTVAAYEPTKGFRELVRSLSPGDRVKVCGGIRDFEGQLTLNLEKLKIISLSYAIVKSGNPVCGQCGKAMKSIGADAGYRCKACGLKAREDEASFEPRREEPGLGWHEVPVCARRHLHKPLSRYGENEPGEADLTANNNAGMKANDGMKVNARMNANAGTEVNTRMKVNAGAEANAGMKVNAGAEANAGMKVNAGTEVNAGMEVKE